MTFTFLSDGAIDILMIVLDSIDELRVGAQHFPNIGEIIFLPEIVGSNVELRLGMPDEVNV